MIRVDVEKNLIGLEDLLIGIGTVLQERGPIGTQVTITKINGSNLPYDANKSLQQKFDELQVQIDNLPTVVDENGSVLPGLILSSGTDLNLDQRLWRKSISTDVAEIYYGTQLILQYNPTTGNLITPHSNDYVIADAIIVEDYQNADTALQTQIDNLDTSTAAVQGLNTGTNANNLVKLDGTGKLPQLDASNLYNLAVVPVPVGSIVFVPYTTPDAGWFVCDGQALSRLEHSELFNKIGTTYGSGDGTATFNIPDLRGLFLRGLDLGKNIDVGRSLGSIQQDSIKLHKHAAGTLATEANGTHAHATSVSYAGSQTAPKLVVGNNDGTSASVATSTSGSHTHSISGSTANAGEGETRPRNMALVAMIKG